MRVSCKHNHALHYGLNQWLNLVYEDRTMTVKESHSYAASEEMYLKAISELTIEKDYIPITSVAKGLGISTVSASEMIHRLEDRNLLKHTPYKGVYLTEEGQRRANSVIRRHRLWECFLTDKLAIPWDRVHDLACRLEHATDSMVTEALADYLGHPATCPHGNPIPSTEGKMPPPEGIPLVDLAPGEGGVILRIHPVSALLISHLTEKGIWPGKEIEVKEIAPFNGPLTLLLGDEKIVVGQEAAAYILVDLSS